MAYSETPGVVIEKLYQMMYDVDELFFQYSIKYYATAGTLLGAIRHRGIIPWDDDLDVSMDKKYKKVLNSEKFISDLSRCGYGIKKFFFGDKIYRLDEDWIGLDVFYTMQYKNKIQYASKRARDLWPREYINESEMYPLKRVPFGEFEITVPADSRKILNRFYKDWNTVAYQQYDHQTDKPIDPPIEVKLSRKARGPAQPITIKRKSCVKITHEPPIYFINCDSHKERYENVIKQFTKEETKAYRVPCVNGKKFTEKKLCEMVANGTVLKTATMSPIEVAISLSHIGIWEKFLAESDAPYVFVFEDDIKLRRGFSGKVNQILANVPEFDILYLYNHNNFQTSDSLEYVRYIKDNLEIYKETVPHNAGGVGYVLKRKYAEFLVSKAYPIKEPIDTFMGTTTFSKRFNYYTVGNLTRYSNNVVAIPKWTPQQSTQGKGNDYEYKGTVISELDCE